MFSFNGPGRPTNSDRLEAVVGCLSTATSQDARDVTELPFHNGARSRISYVFFGLNGTGGRLLPLGWKDKMMVEDMNLAVLADG
ncbi:unnamed protein product [Lactuca virosa]|uniref:Uncharacterized protein n=1 Tax=Lactuca virosa TaxID=75947 RepID=A0AAU9LDE9_9ASTR|nr:unnamed protein product [Lactuca virosa]